MNKVLDYEAYTAEKPNFHNILDDFQVKAAEMLSCDKVLFTMIDQPT